MGVVQCNQPATRLITPGNGAVEGAQCWSLLLADGLFGGGRSQVSFNEWKFMLQSPCTTPIAATLATLFMSPLGDETGVAGERG